MGHQRGGNEDTLMSWSLPNLHIGLVNQQTELLPGSSINQVDHFKNVNEQSVNKLQQKSLATSTEAISRNKVAKSGRGVRHKRQSNQQVSLKSQAAINEDEILFEKSSPGLPTHAILNEASLSQRSLRAGYTSGQMLGLRGSTSASSQGRLPNRVGVTDTTLTVLVQNRTNLDDNHNDNGVDQNVCNSAKVTKSRYPQTAHVNFNTMNYPDRKALYLLGHSPNDTTTQKWLNKLIARRDQRNSQFLERLKSKQDGISTHQQGPNSNNRAFNTRPLNSRGTFRQHTSMAPHRLAQQQSNQLTQNYVNTQNFRSSRLPPSGSPVRGSPVTPRTPRRPGNLDSGNERVLSNSTGAINYNQYSQYSNTPQSARHRRHFGPNEHEITVDLTKENTSNIAYRLLGAYIENNPSPISKSFMNIGEAPATFVREYLQDRCMEKLDFRAICNLWLSKVNYDWDIIEEYEVLSLVS